MHMIRRSIRRLRPTRSVLRIGTFALAFAAFSLRPPVLSGGETRTDADVIAEVEANEARLARGFAAEPVTIDWKVLGGLNYLTGEKTDALKKIDGQQVRVPGFIVPLDDFAEEVTEFLLVPYFGACVHVPPPPPNQMVYITMKGGKKHKIGWWDPVYIEGQLSIKQYDSVFGAAGFQMEAVKVTEYGK